MYQYKWIYENDIGCIEVMRFDTNEDFSHSKRGLTGTKGLGRWFL